MLPPPPVTGAQRLGLAAISLQIAGCGGASGEPVAPTTVAVAPAPSGAAPRDAADEDPGEEPAPRRAAAPLTGECRDSKDLASEELARARALFRAGAEAYETGDYELAAQRFREVYPLGCLPPVAVNLARALDRAGRIDEAMDVLESAMERDDLAPQHLELLRERLKELKR